ncbi:hypothetical protein ACU4GD_45860 [Cupriavidus basilensis]
MNSSVSASRWARTYRSSCMGKTLAEGVGEELTTVAITRRQHVPKTCFSDER